MHISFDGRWPFEEAENTAVFCCEHVFSNELPILYVTHDHDGDWQFLCGGTHPDDRPRLVCLGCMVEKDASLWVLADMPVGWGQIEAAPTQVGIAKRTRNR